MPPVIELDGPTDAALVAAWQAGGEQAATDLVHRHASHIARFLAGLGAAPGDVEDLAQEAFFRAFRALGTWRKESSFRSWLFSIAANVHRDAYRRRRGRTLVPLERHEVPDRHDPAAELVAGETAEQLRAGLASLPRLQREVFLLRVQQGMEYGDIATALGTTAGAARVHYHHAVKRLKGLIR